MTPADHDPSGLTLDSVDETILTALRELHAEIDPVPPGLTDDIKFALTVQALHAEVAELQRLGSVGAGVRSVDYTRAETLTFAGGGYSTMVTITVLGADQVRIDGWVTGGPVTIELRERSRTSSVDVGEDGRFVFEPVDRGLVQFVLHPAEDREPPIITPSIDI